MNHTKIKTALYGSKRDILLFTRPFAALSVIVNANGLAPDDRGKYRILAGQALQAPSALWEDRTTECQVVVGAPEAGMEIVGVTQHDINFLHSGDYQNANLILFGFVDTDKMEPDAAVPDSVKAALSGRVTYVAGDNPKQGYTPPVTYNPTLTDLGMSGIALTPTFDPEVFDYTGGTVYVQNTTVTATASDGADVKMYLNNVVTPVGTINLAEGSNTLRFEVTQETETVVYTVFVAYTPPSTLINTLTMSGVDLTPTFEAGITTYSGTANDATASLSFALEAVTPTANATLNGSSFPLSGVGPYTGTIAWVDGTNEFVIVVTSNAASTTYTFTVEYTAGG